MKNFVHYFLRRCLPLLLALSLSACSQARLRGDPPPVAMVGTTLTGIGHLGANVGIPRYFVNGYWGGNVGGWGGGGSFVSSGFKLPAQMPKEPYMVTVTWITCDVGHIEYVNNMRVNPDARCIKAEHEAVVPVHYSLPEGRGDSGLKIHFLPGNKVEVWYTVMGPSASDYPGPAFPRGPAPDYAPVPETSSATVNGGQ